MYPLDLLDQLRPLVHNRILVDLADGRPSLDLAPCTGRLVTGVLWLPSTGEVVLLLEGPYFRDEPQGITVQASEVSGLAILPAVCGKPARVTLSLPDHALRLWLVDVDRRLNWTR